MIFKIRMAAIWFCTIPMGSQTLEAAELRVATASNFKQTMSRIIQQFEQQSSHTVVHISGSTGKHFAQIENGAPYDLFFAANSYHPQVLEENGRIVAGCRATYAVGRLVLWSATMGNVEPKSILENDYTHLAIANPKLAPYGKAAEQFLTDLRVWDKIQNKIVLGENVNQAFQFIVSGNAQLGLVALSQLVNTQFKNKGSYWEIPTSRHSAIEQQFVLLQDSKAARSFYDFVQTESVRKLIANSGYDVSF